MHKVIIFDMDGVIVDSEYAFQASEVETLRRAGIDVDVSHQYPYMGTTSIYMWQDLKQRYDLPLSVNEYIAQGEAIKAAITEKDGIKPIKGAQDFIRFLVKKDWRLGLASSSTRTEIKANLQALGLTDCFEITVSGEEVAHSKPAPDIFLKAAELLKTSPSDCLVFEDTKNGSRAAKAAGMTCIGFANPDYPAQDLSVCDQIISDYTEIYNLFK